jgi:hypothetical protein
VNRHIKEILMTLTMRRVAMLIGMALVVLPMVLFTVNNPFVPMNIFFFTVAAIVATYVLWMLLLGGDYPTPVLIGMPSVALVILAAAWISAVNITSVRVSAEQATAAIGFYTDEIIISADCHVVRPSTTGIAVTATPDDLGRGCKVTVDTTKNDLYIIPAISGALSDGNYAPDYRTYVFVSPAIPQVSVFAYSSERFRSAQELPAWTHNYVVTTVERTQVPRKS